MSMRWKDECKRRKREREEEQEGLKGVEWKRKGIGR